MNPSPTLPSLPGRVLKNLERACAREGAGVNTPTLDLWANLLRVPGEKGTDARELPAMLSLSRRALRNRVATAVRGGWVEEAKPGRSSMRWKRNGPSDSVRKLCRLCAALWRVRQETERILPLRDRYNLICYNG